MPQTEAEKIRQQHISHELSVKSVASLFYLGAILCFVGGFAFVFSTQKSVDLYQKGQASILNPATLGGGTLLVFGLMVVFWKLAVGLQQLRPWVRVPVIILSSIGLLGFPVGTIISGYVLYLMLSQKSKMVFSPPYQQIIIDAPQIRHRTSAIKTVLVVFLILASFLGLAAYFMSNP